MNGKIDPVKKRRREQANYGIEYANLWRLFHESKC